ncbi:MAG TPA: NAD-dependent epimerase/dehydratase family protein, partial [Planctomycetota bacterium]|nr:NAD-dependent epimerase/dehydratase family protein [Planctomycetota bacterium]
MRALVTGATGFIGRRLVSKLDRPVALTRDPHRARALLGPDLSLFAWDPRAGPPPAEAFKGIEVVFNLAGENVGDKRWTRKR